MYDAASHEGREHAELLLARHSAMEAERANWEPIWERIAELLLPRGQSFTSKRTQEGELRGERVFDNTPSLALDRYAAAVGSMLCPETSQWHGLRVPDPDLGEDDEIREYMELATRMLFAYRYAPKTNFSSQAHECWLSQGAFGSSCLFVDESIGRGGATLLRYRSIHLAEVFFDLDAQGLVDRVHRGRFELKAYQVAQLCALPENDPRRWIMPEAVKRALDGPRPNPNAKFEFIHCVYPNEDANPDRADWSGMAFSSVYLSVADKQIVNRGGYRTMPYAVGRYVTGPREIYGRSPAMTVFRDILMLNEMNKSVIRAGQLHVEPPAIIAEDGALAPFSMAPRALNPGYLTGQGEELVKFLRPEGELGIGLELIQDRRTAVNNAFLVTLFEILVESPDMTATQALLRAQEKGQLLGPTLGRQQSEKLSDCIVRELDILSFAGVLPPMPEALLEAGGAVQIEFKSPLNRLQRADDAIGILKTIEALTPLAAQDPGVLDRIDIDKAAKIIAEAQGAPAEATRSDDEIAALRQAREQQINIQQAIQAAPLLGKTARDLAQASATAGNSPPATPYVQPASE